jgi:hypothetical protein
MLLQLLQKILREQTLPNSLYKDSVTLVEKPRKHASKKKIIGQFPVENSQKVLNKILVN